MIKDPFLIEFTSQTECCGIQYKWKIICKHHSLQIKSILERNIWFPVTNLWSINKEQLGQTVKRPNRHYLKREYFRANYAVWAHCRVRLNLSENSLFRCYHQIIGFSKREFYSGLQNISLYVLNVTLYALGILGSVTRGLQTYYKDEFCNNQWYVITHWNLIETRQIAN